MKTILAVASIWALSSFVTVTTAQNGACTAHDDSCYCEKESLHTKCKDFDQTACCSDYQSAAPTESDIKVILERHNEIREKVAYGGASTCPDSQCDGSRCKYIYILPPASKMNELCWDVELADIAQKLADTCVYGHEAEYSYRADLCGRYDNVGQNIFSGSTTDLTETTVNFLDAINGWHSEVCRLPKSVISNFSGSPDPNKAWGHYTQLIWGETTHVGCGAASYVCDGWMNHLVVCNYGPAGNLGGAPIYETAEDIVRPKLDCPANADATYTHLCNCENCNDSSYDDYCDCTNGTSQYLVI